MSDSGSQPSGSTTTVNNSAPWSGQQPYLQSGFQSAQNLYNQGGPQYYPGTTLAPVAPQSEQAIGLQTGRALSGSPVIGAADRNLTATLNGDYLSPSSNPWLASTYDTAAGQVRSSLDSQFSGAGRYGSGSHQGAIGQADSNLANQIYGGNYQQERQNQISAMGQAVPLANQDYTDISALNNAGIQQQTNAQSQITDQLNRYNYNQQLPYNNLQNYMKMISGNYGQSATTTQPYFTNPTANLLGAGVGAASIYSLLSGAK
jgi:hypothetical protein